MHDRERKREREREGGPRVLSSGGQAKLPSFHPNLQASPPNVACCEPYIALNCIYGDLKFKIF